MLERGIGFEQQYKFWIDYKDQKVGLGYIDFLVEKSLVVELKSSRQLQDLHRAQLISYLKATGCQLGLLLNFKSPTMKDGIERIIYSTR
jgi:GxxExxY protein